MDCEDPAVRWLLESDDASVRFQTLTELVGEPVDSPEVQAARDAIPGANRIRALLSGRRAAGGGSWVSGFGPG